jgi:uroporphyrinogen decarboxylase
MYKEQAAWHALMQHLATITVDYLNAQIAAGAQAVQLFDSWIGCLGQDDYREFILPHMQRLIGQITPGIPVVHFGTGNSHLLSLMKEAGGNVIGLDWRVNLVSACSRQPRSNGSVVQ